MPPTNLSALTSAVQAINELCENAFANLDSLSGRAALTANTDIEHVPVGQKSARFFRHFLPLRQQMVELLTESYRRYFKVALAHDSQTGDDPDGWAWIQLQPALHAAFEWIREWYVLACEGENQSVRHLGSLEYIQGGTSSLSVPTTVPQFSPTTGWRAPAWLFGISLAYFGFGPLKTQHVPNMDSEERLGRAHTCLLLKGARRVFLWQLGAACRTVRNEETAAAGAIPQAAGGGQTEEPNNRKDSKRPLKGVDGLVRKADFSQYMHNLTEKQQLAFSLKFEYELGLAEIASRMGLDRKTAYEHIEAAKRRIDQARSNEKSKARRPKSEDE